MADPLSIVLNIEDIIEKHVQLAEVLRKKTNEATEKITIMTHAYIVNEASKELKSTKDEFIESLKMEKINDYTWGITIPHKSLFIEDGIPSGFDMLPGFLNSPKAKISSKGNKYLVIPFKHNKSPSRQSNFQQQLSKIVQKEFKKENISYGKIDKNPDGSPKMGLVGKLNIAKGPALNMPKPGQLGPSGKPISIHAAHAGTEGPSGRPYLWGVRSYQNMALNKNNQFQIKKDVMTFRTASSTQQGKEMWIHPGLKAHHFLEKAAKFAQEQWDGTIKPEILRDLGID